MLKKFKTILVALCTLLPVAAHSTPNTTTDLLGLCRRLATQTERYYGLPPQLLSAIAITESGTRTHAGSEKGKIFMAWPWTINVDGRGYFFRTKQDAIAYVRHLQSTGKRSIDVGCMQVNLKYHARAFASLEEAFDPAANIKYAAQFVSELSDRYGSWTEAVGRYHSATPNKAQNYRSMVLKRHVSERVLQRQAAVAMPVPKSAVYPQGQAGLAAPQPLR